MSDEYYEVDHVYFARLKKARKRKYWEFRVRWKGYGPDDDTWEKKESFGLTDKQSDSIRSTNLSLKNFWDRTDVKGRDVDDPDQFQVGEEFEMSEEIKPRKRPTARKRTGGKPPVPPRIPSIEPEIGPTETNAGKRKQISGHDSLDSDLELMHESANLHEETAPPTKKPRREITNDGNTDSQKSVRQQAPSAKGQSALKTLSKTKSEQNDRKRVDSSRNVATKVVRNTGHNSSSDSDNDEIGQDRPRSNHSREPSNPLPPKADKTPSRKSRQSVVPESSDFELDTASNKLPKNLPPNAVSEIVPDSDDDEPDPLFDAEDPEILPPRPHRNRVLMQVLDDPVLMELPGGAISAKARALAVRKAGPAVAAVPTSTIVRDKAKARASLLVFDKNANGLSSVKGKYAPVRSPPPEDPRVPAASGSGSGLGSGAVASGWGDDNTGGGSGGWGSNDPAGDWGEWVNDDFADGWKDNAKAIGKGKKVDALSKPDLPPAGPPPTAAELLDLSGLDREAADALEDFEDNNDMDEDTEINPFHTTPQPLRSTSGFSEMSVTANSSWNRASTIFGPLGVGSKAPEEQSLNVRLPRFRMSLSPAVTVTVVLKDVQFIPGLASIDVIVSQNPTGTPGKFYDSTIDKILVGIIGRAGSSARVDGEDGSREDFQKWLSRLNEGEVFITIAGPQVLLFASSKNGVFNERLNMPATLTSLKEAALVTPISIEDYQKYAEVALNGQQAEWL